MMAGRGNPWSGGGRGGLCAGVWWWGSRAPLWCGRPREPLVRWGRGGCSLRSGGGVPERLCGVAGRGNPWSGGGVVGVLFGLVVGFPSAFVVWQAEGTLGPVGAWGGFSSVWWWGSRAPLWCGRP